ncbi:MAG: tetratricopeptide repeat protein [Pseudomonadota bacterium]
MSDNPDNLATARHEIGELLDRQRWAMAERRLAEVLPNYPDNLELRYFQAIVDWVADRDRRAVEILEGVLVDEPTYYDARYLLARVKLGQDEYRQAEEMLLGLLADYPESAALYATYAEVMLRTMHFEKAEALAAEALKRDPDHEGAMNVHVLCGFVNSSNDEQRERLQRLLQEHPDQMQTTIRLVQHLIEQGRHEEAFQLSRELVLADPANGSLVELASELRRANHWSMKPLWPMQRFGWAGSIGIWFGAVLLFRSGVLDGTPTLANYLVGALLIYVVYSWVWPPLLRRILR